MRFLRTASVVLVVVGLGGLSAEGSEEEAAPKTPTPVEAPSDPEADSSAPGPAVGESRGARKKPTGRSFRPSIDVPAGDAVSFPVDI